MIVSLFGNLFKLHFQDSLVQLTEYIWLQKYTALSMYFGGLFGMLSACTTTLLQRKCPFHVPFDSPGGSSSQDNVLPYHFCSLGNWSLNFGPVISDSSVRVFAAGTLLALEQIFLMCLYFV